MPIRILDPQVANRIAAGEVIERPASVVKELIENALDAGATRLTIESRGGGSDLIRVSDNGCGIPAGEVALAFRRHATSKIATAEDLDRIQTLGFRGEALASIAAVAGVTIITRTGEVAGGIYARLENGEVVQEGQRGAPVGTTVTVERLFANVPARRKFLKSPTSETGQISHLVSQYALAYPEVQFTLLSDGRTVFQSTGSGDLGDVLIKVYGLETARGLIPLEAGAEGETGGQEGAGELAVSPWHRASPSLHVTGYVSQPSVHRASRSYLSFFVNRRWVQSRMLAFAVEEAYHTLLPAGRHPIVVLNLTLPTDQVDVNVHPTKSEVRFLFERFVYATVQRRVRETLVRAAGIPAFRPELPSLEGREGGGEVASPAIAALELFAPPSLPVAAPALPTQPPLSPGFLPGEETKASPPAPAAEPGGPPAPAARSSHLPPLRILGQVAQTYIIAEAPEGLYLIDQHTAHERVLYEELMSQRQRLTIQVQTLLTPLTLDLTPRQATVAAAQTAFLAHLGFQIEPFGGQTILLRGVPPILAQRDPAAALIEILDSLAEEGVQTGSGGNPEAWVERVLTITACHAAVRAGQTLSLPEMQQLVELLEKTTLPRTCPHGRPILLHLSHEQLERGFGRR